MNVRGAVLACLASSLLSCASRRLPQHGQTGELDAGGDASQVADATADVTGDLTADGARDMTAPRDVIADHTSISPDGDDPAPTDAWSVFAKLGAPGLNAIWGSSDSDIWVAGGYVAAIPGPALEGTGPAGLPRIVHYDGKGWRDVAVTGSAMPAKIWGRAANDIWTTGGSIRHFDGSAWRDVASPTGAGAVWGAAPNDVWFASGIDLLHWNGSAISRVATPPGDIILAITGFSSSDVWAGGGSGRLVHWDGTVWSPVATGSMLYVYGLWGAGPDDVWGVGNGGNRVHWDGVGISTADHGYTSFYAVAGTGARDIWGVGDCCWQGGDFKAWVSHFDGVEWTDATVPGFAGVSDVWVSPSGTYFALADGNAVLYTGPRISGSGGAPGPGASPACVTASGDLTTKLSSWVDDAQQHGGPCNTVLDCKLFVPTIACGDGYRLTGCPVVVSDADARRIVLDKLQTPQCGAIAADSTCQAQIFMDCAQPVAACVSGTCTSVAGP